ncbi:class I SAM-dependent methyltransferase [Hymenobacter psychrophilus]|uniref:Methyltransferase domain-containing protein n=1 Tax=Hymenobacter psychrophilus TaxID=651662 RepID=A0A1H3GU81_9BACT|nr:class I SAM-dependent methyltransferase [Hymenobacter psychrophilus]SDY06535.1 Methyltransferase domain-containing protein [Hymenobacter psychrophilus]
MPVSLLPDSGFDYVAAFYDPLARLVYGRALQRAQQAALVAGLPLVASAPRVLVVGGGSGWVLGEVLRRAPKARIVYLEASPRMLARSRVWLARHWPQAADQVEFRLGTEAALAPAEQFDAVVAFFLLDLFEPARLRQLVARLGAARAPDGVWLLADFGPPRRWWHRLLLRLMYGFFGLTTGISARQRPPIEAELARLGLRAAPAGQFFGGMVEASVWRDVAAEQAAI